MRSILTLMAVCAALAPSQGPALTNSSTQQSDDTQLELVSITAILQAVEDELICSDLCYGGESIRLGLRACSGRGNWRFELVYEVPDVLRAYRNARLDASGLAFLADDLGYTKGLMRRDTTHEIDPEEFESIFAACPVKIAAVIRSEPSQEQLARQQYRAYLVTRALRLP